MKKTAKRPAKNSSVRAGAIPAVPIEAVFSFLKGTKGTSSWTKQDFAGTLKISLADAAKILPVIQMQGYINPYHDEWVTRRPARMFRARGRRDSRLKRW